MFTYIVPTWIDNNLSLNELMHDKLRNFINDIVTFLFNFDIFLFCAYLHENDVNIQLVCRLWCLLK